MGPMTDFASIETYQAIWLVALVFVNHILIYLYRLYTERQKDVKKIYGLTPSERQLKAEFRNGLMTTPVHSLIILLFLVSGLLKVTSEDIGTIVLTFFVVFWWTEFWHYISHRAMHLKVFLSIHREHHRSHITNPWSAVSFSLLEKTIFSLGIVSFAALYSHYFSFSFHGFCAYYTFYFATNILGHSNIEFRSARYPFSLMGYIINSPSYHAMHHARYVKNYGLITSVFDRLFNTRWEDSDGVLIRAAEGKPLKKLSEKP